MTDKNQKKNKSSTESNLSKSKAPIQPQLNLGEKSIFELPNIDLLNVQARILTRSYWVIIILIISITLCILSVFAYLVLDDQFEWALLQDGTDLVCVK